MYQVHAQNQELVDKIIACGYHIATYSTSSRMGAHQGHVRYGIYVGDTVPYGTRSKNVIMYEQAPYARNYKPSIKQERLALERLLKRITND